MQRAPTALSLDEAAKLLVALYGAFPTAIAQLEAAPSTQTKRGRNPKKLEEAIAEAGADVYRNLTGKNATRIVFESDEEGKKGYRVKPRGYPAFLEELFILLGVSASVDSMSKGRSRKRKGRTRSE